MIVLGLHGGVRVAVKVHGDSSFAGKVAEGFRGSFARRYLPVESVELWGAEAGVAGVDAVVEWMPSDGFRVARVELGGASDYYRIESPPPAAYTNESPVFFILQVAARAYARRGMILFTDSIAFASPKTRHGVLVLGYPHSGKSTLLALAVASGYEPLSTENTVVKVDTNGSIRVVGGSRVLVVDPRAVERYIEPGRLKVSGRTKHGYLIVDLDDSYNLQEVEASYIYVIHCSFAARGVSFEPVTGRKSLKLLWHFATSLVKGDDFYNPSPLCLEDSHTLTAMAATLSRIGERYRGRFYEVFGGHQEVFKAIVDKLEESGERI